MTSIGSLRALPPKQALALALMEKARRTKAREEKERALQQLRQREQDESASAPSAATDGSLVLDRTHVISDLYYKRRRFKVYWGGRGGVKSWGAAEAIVRIMAERQVRVLCMREFQNSIADSSHKLLSDTIKRLGLDSWFTVTQTSIRSRSGSECIFRGMHGKEQSLRSIEGIDILWIEEAQSFTSGSWASIEPTIRKNESEIWVTYNLINENDATHRMFYRPDGSLTMPPEDLIIHKVTYLDNPYFPGSVLERAMIRMRDNDQDLYEHVWLGMPQKKSNAIIFSGRYVVEPFDWELVASCSDRAYLGADFGFADDPATLTRLHITGDSPDDQRPREAGLKYLGRTLWVTHAVGGRHIEIDRGDDAAIMDLAALYDHVPGARDWPIKADSSRPETISHMGRKGFAISAAEKWPGSVEDGITHLRGFQRIVIRQPLPSEDPYVIAGLNEHALEAYMYRYKVDPRAVDDKGQPLVLPVVVDKHNHYWDADRYSLDGYIQRSGAVGMWERLGRAA